MWITAGLAYGFMLIGESEEFLNKTSDYYYTEFELSLLWKYSASGIQWLLHLQEAEPMLATKDEADLTLARSASNV